MKTLIKFPLVLTMLAIFFIIIGLTLNSYAQTKGSPPVINFSYAQERIRQGDDWRIYISASDPDGDMSKIYCVINQPGGQLYHPDMIRLKKGVEGNFSGYLVLRTSSNYNLWGVSLTLTLMIEDRAGHESKPVDFPLTFNGEPMKPLPSDREKELNQRIGYIGIDLMRRESF
jgi:hypothetical protein